jgi:transposase
MVDTIMDTATQARRIKRPNFSVEFKRQIVEATLAPEASAALIAREHGINANLLFKWRRHYLAGDYGLPDVAATAFAAHEAAALNWMPVTLAPQAANAPGSLPSSSDRVYEIECGQVRLRLSGDISTATLIEIVRGLSQ